MSHSADNAPMPSGGDVTPGTGVGFLHVSRGKYLLVENRNGADTIAAVFVGPNSRCDVVHGVDDISVSVVADGPVGPLRRITNNRYLRIDQQIQPISCLFNEGAPFKPYPAQILSAAQCPLNNIGQTS